MKKCYLLLILISVFAITGAKAQLQIDTPAIIQGYLTSQYIFEGEVIDQCVHEDSNGNLYTSNLIQISKMFKGDLSCGTVRLITMGGVIESKTHIVTDYISLNVGFIGVFMSKNSEYPEAHCHEATNAPELMFTLVEIGSIQYLFDLVNDEVEGFNSQFPTIEVFYDFLIANNIPITNCDATIIAKARSRAYIAHHPQPVVKINPPKVATPHELQRLAAIENMVTIQSPKGLGKTTADLEFTISNTHFINSNGDMSVDINVKSNVTTTYLSNFAFRLKYNKNMFGGNVASSLTATYGSLFDDPADYDTPLILDYKDSIVAIYVSGKYQPNARVQVTTTPTKLMTITIPVANCKYTPKFKIDTFALAGNYTSYALNATDPIIPGHLYDNIILGNQIIGPFCDVEITSMNKSHITAGTREQLTIYGNNFGSTKGSGGLFIKSADVINQTLGSQDIALDDYDIVSWSDNQIVIQMPGMIEKAYYNGTSYVRATPGSGPLTVKDGYGNSYFSSFNSNLTINYVAFEGYQGTGSLFYKSNQLLFSTNSDSIYHFNLHTNITNTGMINCIKAAFRRWSCYTGVAFVLDATTTSVNAADNDNVNVVKLTSTFSSDVLAYCNIRTKNICTSGISKPFSVNDLDLEINSTKVDSFDYDTTGSVSMGSNKYDFFQIILHEIGHALQLGHLSFSGDIMYPTSGKGTTAANRKLTLSTNNLNAGDYVVNNSLANTYGLTCSYKIPMKKLGTSCRTTGLAELLSMGDIKVFPNPFTNTINISVPVMASRKAEIKIINCLGEQVYSENYENLNSAIEVKNLSLPKGIYFIFLSTETANFVSKIVCAN